MKREKLPNIIFNVRKSHNLTQEELGKILGVGRTTVVGYEKGTIHPSIQVLNKLCSEFGITLNECVDDGSTSSKGEIVRVLNTLAFDVRSEKYTHRNEKIDKIKKTIIVNAIKNITKIIEELDQIL